MNKSWRYLCLYYKVVFLKIVFFSRCSTPKLDKEKIRLLVIGDTEKGRIPYFDSNAILRLDDKGVEQVCIYVCVRVSMWSYFCKITSIWLCLHIADKF